MAHNRRAVSGWISLVVALVLLLVFEIERLLVLIPGYRPLFDTWGFAVPRSLRSLAEIAVVLVAVCALHRKAPAWGLRELGFRNPAWRGLGFAVLAAAPMFVVFAVAYPLSASFEPLQVLYLAVLSPIAEETVYRGFAFGQLWRRAGWPLWAAILAPAALFGYGHVQGAESWSADLGVFALTAAGAVAFAWVFARWRTLAAPIGLHVLMNLCWNVWEVGESALAGWVPFALQITVVVVAIVLTSKWTEPASPRLEATPADL